MAKALTFRVEAGILPLMTKIGIPKETRTGETRVAATPESTKKLIKKGFQIHVARGAGESANFPDAAFVAAGATIVDQDGAWGCEIVLKVIKPTNAELLKLKKGSLLISHLEPYNTDGTFEKLAELGVDAIAMELMPRTSRAQAMDVLSSQAGIAGYRAVIEGASRYGRFFPMMMTSAGSSKPCKFAILGVGVAGLQAIATARRMGAMVEAYDVRKEVKEQILSLGAKCIEIDIGEEGSGTGGYAKELSEEAKKKQQAAMTEKLKGFDIILSTANIPGKKSPTLISEDAVKGMRPGSVIVDLAAANGGNCPLTEADKIVVKHGVTLVGITNFPALVPSDASHFYSQNLVNLLDIVWTKPEKDSQPAAVSINVADDIIAASLVVNKGALCQRR
jgi:NAD(P) transhydrogenase subunit alpha